MIEDDDDNDIDYSESATSSTFSDEDSIDENIGNDKPIEKIKVKSVKKLKHQF